MNKQKSRDFQQFNEERFMKNDIIKNRNSSAFLLNFLPKQHMKQHNHPDRELYLYVIEGSGTLFVDEKEVKITVGDVVLCEPNEQIGFTNTSQDNVTIFATMTKLKA